MKLLNSLFALLCVASAGSASAARIYVTTPTAGIGTGACSLQEAIYSSVLHDTLDGTHGIAIDATDQGTPPDHFVTTGCVIGDGNDTIVLPTFGVLSMSAFLDGDAYNVFGPTATPVIFSTITVEGNGATLRWDGPPGSRNNVRLFAVGTASITTPNGAASGTGSLTLRNVYVAGFHVKGGNGGLGGGGGGLGAGGAIYLGPQTSATIENSTFDGNGAVGGNGGSADASHAGEGGGGGLSGSGGSGAAGVGGGGGGARGDGGNTGGDLSVGAGGGGGGTVFAGGNGHIDEATYKAVGGPGGYLCGGNGGDEGNQGHDANCDGGGGGAAGFSGHLFGDTIADGGNGKYGGGGGGGSNDGGNGGFGGGGGAGLETKFGFIAGGNGGFGGGGGGIAGNVPQSGQDPGKGGAYGGNADRSNGGGGGALGGAIFSDGGTLTIHNSTFFDNYVTRGVGGGGTADNGGDAGGAVFVRDANLAIVNSTFTRNQSTGSGAAVVAYRDTGTFGLTLDDTIMANNGPDECFTKGGVQASGAGNLIMRNGEGALTPCPGVVLTDDPQLGPLQDNGGFTRTMAIPFGSVAMSAADAATSLATDQRGQARPQAGGYDIGAYEICRRQLAGGLIEPMFCSETTFAGYPTTSLTIQSSTSSGGTVTPAPGTYTEPQNTVEVLSAAPAAGYYLKNWTGNVAQPNSLTTTIVIGDQPQSVTANFQLHDFTLSADPTSFTLPLGGTTATSDVTATALGDFGDEITLTATGHPSGVVASFSANPVTPVAGTATTATLTIAVGPSAVPQSFTETITGNSSGLSGALSHAAQVSVTVVITADALVQIIEQDLALGCIVGSGFAQSLIAKVNAYQTLASGGHVQAATNVLAAFQYEVQAQIGQHIVTRCMDPVTSTAFSPGETLIADAQALQATLGTQAKAAPIMGSVTSTTDAGTAGARVNLLSGKTVVATATTDAIGFYYFDSTALVTGVQYTAQVTIPKGYKTSVPASQTFAWIASSVKLADFVLN
jgi:hypothetical protein